MCVFGTGEEEEKGVNRDRGGLVSVIELRANRHTLRLFVLGLGDRRGDTVYSTHTFTRAGHRMPQP